MLAFAVLIGVEYNKEGKPVSVNAGGCTLTPFFPFKGMGTGAFMGLFCVGGRNWVGSRVGFDACMRTEDVGLMSAEWFRRRLFFFTMSLTEKFGTEILFGLLAFPIPGSGGGGGGTGMEADSVGELEFIEGMGNSCSECFTPLFRVPEEETDVVRDDGSKLEPAESNPLS